MKDYALLVIAGSLAVISVTLLAISISLKILAGG